MFRFEDSPLIQELFAERTRKFVMISLKARFGDVPVDIPAELSGVSDLRIWMNSFRPPSPVRISPPSAPSCRTRPSWWPRGRTRAPSPPPRSLPRWRPPRRFTNVLGRVHDLASLVNELLTDTLHWPLQDRIDDPQKISYGWSADELHAQGLEKQLLDGEVRQAAPFTPGSRGASSSSSSPTSASIASPCASAAASSPTAAATPASRPGNTSICCLSA